MISKCTVSTSRGLSDSVLWLDVDPKKICDTLFGQRYKAMWSLEEVRLKGPAKSLLKQARGFRHLPEEIAEIIMYVDGGGERPSSTGPLPSTWAVAVLTKGEDESIAFDRAFGGSMTTDAGCGTYVGAEAATSSTAEIAAQIHALLCALANPLRVGCGVRHTIIFDNETAAKFA